MPTFLSLPGEIRNEIYDHATFPHHDAVAVHHCTTPRDVVAKVLKSPIFRLSSRIRVEALVRLFKTKDFDFSDYASALNFLTWAGTYGETLITRITILGLKPMEVVDDAVVSKPRAVLSSGVVILGYDVLMLGDVLRLRSWRSAWGRCRR